MGNNQDHVFFSSEGDSQTRVFGIFSLYEKIPLLGFKFSIPFAFVITVLTCFTVKTGNYRKSMRIVKLGSDSVFLVVISNAKQSLIVQ
jgi:hypothetical protein